MVGYVLVVLYFWVAQGHLYVQLSPKLLLMSALGLLLCLVFALGHGHVDGAALRLGQGRPVRAPAGDCRSGCS